MSAFARYLARQLWWGMLWLMRRPAILRLQRASIAWLPAPAQARAVNSLHRQNRFARKYGLGSLTVMFNFLLASIAISATYEIVTSMYEGGYLTLPDEIRDRVVASQREWFG